MVNLIQPRMTRKIRTRTNIISLGCIITSCRRKGHRFKVARFGPALRPYHVRAEASLGSDPPSNMPEKSKQRFSVGGQHGYRRSWWKRVFRRGSSEDLVEYVSRMAAGPLFIISVVLVFGLTVEPSERKEYIDSLTSPFSWIGGLFSGSGETVEAVPIPEVEPAPIARPAVEPDPVSADSVVDDTTSQPRVADSPVESSSPGPSADASPGEGTWYVVKRGQTLYDIARSEYGDVSQWKRIWFYNLERLPRPNSVKYGMELFIPVPGELSEAEAQRLEELLESGP
jgi:hypothetical protein